MEDTAQSLTILKRIKATIQEFDFEEGTDYVAKGNRLMIESLFKDYFELKEKDFVTKEQILKTFISICKTHTSPSVKKVETPKNYIFYSIAENYIEQYCETLSVVPTTIIGKYTYSLIVQFIKELMQSKQLSIITKIISFDSLRTVFSLIKTEFKNSTIYIRNCSAIFNELLVYGLYEELNRIVTPTFTLEFIQSAILKQTSKDLFVFVSELIYNSIKNQSNTIIFSQEVNDFFQLILDSIIENHIELSLCIEFDEFSKCLNSLTKTNSSLVVVNFGCNASVDSSSLRQTSRL